MGSFEEVLDRNDLVYNILPPRWVFGLPIGNGQIGGMVWVEDETKVIITLDHVWAWDLRQASPRRSGQTPLLQLGRLQGTFVAKRSTARH